MNWDKASKELSKKLDPANVKPAPKGKYGDYIEGVQAIYEARKYGDYIEGVHAIYEANRIFGFNGWSYSLDSVQMTNATRDGEKHRVGYFAQVTVTAHLEDGKVQRSDVGHGQGFGKSEGDAHDSAVKEAATDALKRALRTFGNPFGLALYDKTKANVGVDFDSAATRDRIKAAIEKQQDVQALWDHPKTQEALGQLDDEHKAELEKAKADRMARVYQAPEAAE